MAESKVNTFEILQAAAGRDVGSPLKCLTEETNITKGNDVSATDITNSPSEDNRSADSSEIESQFSNEDSREKFLNYWKSAVQTFGATENGMLLRNSTVETKLITADRDNVLDALIQNIPFPVDRVIEIGAGIGRITCFLQKLCRCVVAVDFLEEYIKKNKEENYDPVNRPEDKFVCADATKFSMDSKFYDVVFWNWLLMYLSDDELYGFILKAVESVKVGGYLFCRESCGEPSDGNRHRPWAVDGNPSSYRIKEFYTDLFTRYLKQNGYSMEIIVNEKEVSAFKQQSSNASQFMWLLKRTA